MGTDVDYTLIVPLPEQSLTELTPDNRTQNPRNGFPDWNLPQAILRKNLREMQDLATFKASCKLYTMWTSQQAPGGRDPDFILATDMAELGLNSHVPGS